ncbi:MAG TPA: S9 family peptidase [Saprospiraceae bacterium]|nr:S9 family peptidase [Saprospiraceae bacterium]
MKIKLLFMLVCLFMGLESFEQTPIIDRQIFFGNPEIAGGQLSPDGQYISFLKEYDGIMNVWVKAFDEPFENAKPVTDSKRPLYGYFWSDDSKYILYAKDKDGDENINIFAVDPRETLTEPNVPVSRNLTPLQDVQARIYMVSERDPDIIMIGLNDRDKAWHDLYQLEISTGKLTLIQENKQRITGYTFDWDEILRVVSQTTEDGSTIMLYKEGENLIPIYETSVTEQAYIATWTPDNQQFYLVTNKGDLDLSTLYLMDPKTRKLTKIESDPEQRVDFGGLSVSRITRELLYTTYTDDRTRRYFKNKDKEAEYKYLLEQFPGREVSYQSATRDEKKYLIAVWGDKYASDSYFFNSETRELIHQYTPRTKLKAVEQYLAPMVPVQYKSSDGLTIPAYLTIPVGKEPNNLPVVVLVHGGPKGPRDNWGYNSIVQFLANRGYAVLQPNFRASGGYGKNFLNAGDLQWGKLMQDDITWGVKYLIGEGLADKDKVAIMGGSYGGYATLAGLAFTPELYAAGVDIVGPSNIFTLLESVPPYWEAARAHLYGMVGDPNTEEGAKLIKEASPLFKADQIDRPLLIIQGANDPRVKQAESDQIVIALRDRGKQVNYILADDEGHGFAKPVNNMAMFAEIERFLAPILGGRYQKEMPDDVSRRLEEMRVDIQKVIYEPPKEVETSGSLPVLKNTLIEGNSEYDISIEIQGQNIQATKSRTIARENGLWNITEVSRSMMGESSDVLVLTESLSPVSREIQQMGMTIPVQFKENGISLVIQGNNIDIQFKGAYILDGAALEVIAAGLPLVTGYQLGFEMPDLMTAQAKTMLLEVKGTDTVNGSDCFVIHVNSVTNPTDKMTIWLNKQTLQTEKIEQIAPAMGNAKITTVRK